MRSAGLFALVGCASGLSITMSAAPQTGAAAAPKATSDGTAPLLLRAARGERVERTPVWMMRQAGRHMAAYRALVQKWPTFRERSEIPEAAYEISLQPYRAYGVDGVILFSDILTPLPAMGVDFAISEGGAIKISPIRTREAFKAMTDAPPFDPATNVPFVGDVLKKLRAELDGTGATLLGFVGLPFTLGTYVVEGATGTKTGFAEMRALRADQPDLCRDILSLLADRIAEYAIYQIDSGAQVKRTLRGAFASTPAAEGRPRPLGAQVIQVFDSWAGHLTPDEFDEWAAPYQRRVVGAIREARPDVPVIIYMAPDTHSRGGALLEKLAASGATVVSVDHTIPLADAKARLAAAGYGHVGVQGNLDPEILSTGTDEEIVKATHDILAQARACSGVMDCAHAEIVARSGVAAARC